MRNETEKIKMILKKYPDRLPIVCQKHTRCRSDVPDIDKIKYLVPNDITIGQFLVVITMRIKLSPQQSIFLCTDKNKMLSASESLLHTYDKHKSTNNMLYLYYIGENVFGSNLP